MGYWPVVKRVLKDSHVVLEILDARMPELSKNTELEEKAKYYEKELITVFNKIDLISPEALNKLRELYPNAFFVSGSKNIGLKKLKVALTIRAKRAKIEGFKVGVVGYPNVGKSAIINAITHRARTKVSEVAGTTKGIQWVNAGAFLIIDSPGVVPFEDNEVKLGLLGAKNPSKMRNLMRVAFAVIRNTVKINKEALERYYNLKVEENDEYEVLLEIGKRKNFLRKGGLVDEHRTALGIIKDWQTGKLNI